MSTNGFDVVLCPVDFSDISADALRQAASLTACTSGKLVVAYANWLDVPPYFTESTIENLKRQARDSMQHAQRSLRTFVESTLGPAGREVETRVVEGSPVQAIPRLAEEAHAGVIVMGTHGRSGVNRWMLGSVAEHVIRESTVPVLTTRAAPRESLHHILVPVNDTVLSRQALMTATQLASRCKADVTVLNVAERNGEAEIGNLCTWIPSEARAHCTIRDLVRHGDPSEEIVALATGMPCDLIVLGAPMRRFFDSMVLSKTALRVIRHAPCPVLSLGSPRDFLSLGDS